MKRFLLIALVLGTIGMSAMAQRTYFTSQGEYIFSWSGYQGPGINGTKSVTRFTLFPNSEIMFNADTKGILGTYFGVGIRNVGFIYKDNDINVTHKRRALSLGVPLMIKLGDLENDNFLFFGGEIEAFFHYKRKDWAADGTKSKYGTWFSEELNLVQPSAMLGYCKNHLMFKVKYYFYDFFNQEYTNLIGEQPYLGKNSNIIYFSIAFRQEMGGNKGEFEFDEEESDEEGFDFGYRPLINDFYRN